MEYKQENKLTEPGRNGYRGDDAYPRILIVDVVHSISLLACIVSDRRWWDRA